MEEQKVIMAANLERELAGAIDECHADKKFVLVDETTERLCLPVVGGFECMQGVETIVIKAGDEHKTLDSLSHVWSELQRMGATRHQHPHHALGYGRCLGGRQDGYQLWGVKE